MTQIKCWDCHGFGKAYMIAGSKPTEIKCPRCLGDGQVPAVMKLWVERGKAMKAERLAKDKTLSQWCNEHGWNRNSASLAERGHIDPDKFLKNPRKVY